MNSLGCKVTLYSGESFHLYGVSPRPIWERARALMACAAVLIMKRTHEGVYLPPRANCSSMLRKQ